MAIRNYSSPDIDINDALPAVQENPEPSMEDPVFSLSWYRSSSEPDELEEEELEEDELEEEELDEDELPPEALTLPSAKPPDDMAPSIQAYIDEASPSQA